MIILQTEVNYTRLGRRIREKRLEKEMKQQDIIYGQKKPMYQMAVSILQIPVFKNTSQKAPTGQKPWKRGQLTEMCEMENKRQIAPLMKSNTFDEFNTI